MISTWYGYVSNAVNRTVETVQNNRVTQAAHRALDSTKTFFQNTVHACLEAYGPQGPVGEVGEVEQPPVADKEEGPSTEIGETWQEIPGSILPKDPLAAAIPAPQQTPVVVLAHQDDLLGPRRGDIDLSTVDLKELEKSSADIRARHAARKAGGQ